MVQRIVNPAKENWALLEFDDLLIAGGTHHSLQFFRISDGYRAEEGIGGIDGKLFHLQRFPTLPLALAAGENAYIFDPLDKVIIRKVPMPIKQKTLNVHFLTDEVVCVNSYDRTVAFFDVMSDCSLGTLESQSNYQSMVRLSESRLLAGDSNGRLDVLEHDVEQ